MKIKHEGYQPNIPKFVASAENRLSPRKFCEFLCVAQKADPTGFRVKDIECHGETFSFVMGNHAMSRGRRRSCWTTDRVQQVADRVVSSPLVNAVVRSHQVFWSDEDRKTVAYDPDGITATLVVDSKTHSCWVFAAGVNYVLLLTMLELASNEDQYRVRPNTDVIRLNEDGSVEYDVSRIHEVKAFIETKKEKAL